MNKVAGKMIAKVGQVVLYGMSGYELARITDNGEHEEMVVKMGTQKTIVSDENKSDVDFGLIALFITIAILFAGLVIFGLKYYIKRVTRAAPVNLNLT